MKKLVNFIIKFVGLSYTYFSFLPATFTGIHVHSTISLRLYMGGVRLVNNTANLKFVLD